MPLLTSTSTVNQEAGTTSSKSKPQQEQNYIWTPLEDSLVLNHNECRTPEYWGFYKKHIPPNQVNKLAYDLARAGIASANEIRQFIMCEPFDSLSADRTRTKRSTRKFKKESTAIVKVAVLIFLLLCLNGACFWSFIFELLTH